LEEILICCSSILFLSGLLIGVFSFSVYYKRRNGRSKNEPQIKEAEIDDPLDEAQQHKEKGQKNRSNILETLLSIIGLWLGLPSIYSASQRLFEDFIALGWFTQDISNKIKLAADVFLLGILMVGLIVLILVVITGWTKGVLWDSLILPGVISVKNKIRRRKKASPISSTPTENNENRNIAVSSTSEGEKELAIDSRTKILLQLLLRSSQKARKNRNN
jgi:hypothetical protein